MRDPTASPPRAARGRSIAWLLVLVLLLGACAPAAPGDMAPNAGTERLAPTVVLISIDGFRWDYFDSFSLPTIERIAAEGVRARSMIPAFPTKTFPNHYTLVTGLYPANHGIIANNMHDPELGSFSLANREAVQDPRWWGGTPIWVTAERAGQRTAAFFWPGSEAPVQGTHPTYWTEYDGSISGPERVAQVLSWLELPAAERPTFITLYFSVVDDAGHWYGPDSPQLAAAVDSADMWMGQLVRGLEARGLLDQIDLILTSDHGMSATSPERAIALDDYLDLEEVRVIDWNPVAMLQPPAGREEEVYRALRDAHPNLRVYRREEVPSELNFRGHPRIPPIIAIADDGWVIATRDRIERQPERLSGGNHGYDHRLPSMGALFVARGPSFREGTVVEPFESVNVYGVMAAILGLTPEPNDGDPRVVEGLLRPAAARAGAF